MSTFIIHGKKFAGLRKTISGKQAICGFHVMYLSFVLNILFKHQLSYTKRILCYVCEYIYACTIYPILNVIVVDEPNNAGQKENCLEYYFLKGPGYRWNDRTCTDIGGYICQCRYLFIYICIVFNQAKKDSRHGAFFNLFLRQVYSLRNIKLYCIQGNIPRLIFAPFARCQRAIFISL